MARAAKTTPARQRTRRQAKVVVGNTTGGVPMRPDDPSLLTPNERRGEVASILAAGILRLRARAAIPGDDPPAEISPESATARLEVPAETVLSVIHGS